jgi:hypothetical protein
MKQNEWGSGMLDWIGPRRVWLAGVLLLVGIFTGPLVAHPAAASIGFCRTDPMVKLSDGTVVHLKVEVHDAASDVQQITYTLHVPAGTSLDQVHYAGPLSGKENVLVFADSPANTYDTDTLVSTGTPAVDVSASTSVSGVGSGATSGTSGQDLLVHIAG